MLRTILIAGLAGLLAGCSKTAETGIPVEGRVQVDGKPAAGAIVTLHPANAAPSADRPSGQVAADGAFHIPSAAPGDYRVTVAWYTARAPRKGAYSDESLPVSQLPLNYVRPDGTPLTATVAAGQPLNLDIKKK